MKPQVLDMDAVNAAFRELAVAKQWQGYHTPKNLAAAISVEAAELLAEFQWLSDTDSVHLVQEPAAKQKVAAELADILMYVSELSRRLEIDLTSALEQKIACNRQRWLE